MSTTFYTVRDLLRYAASSFTEEQLFFGHGTTNAFDEAAYLVLHTLHLPIDQLDTFLDARLLPNEIDNVLKVIKRRISERIPAPYITNEAWLQNYVFYIDERVIIPRSYLGEVLTHQSADLPQAHEVHSLLELCTGSGCLSIIAADTFEEAQIHASDLSHEALEVAQINIRDYKLENRIQLFQGDLFEALPMHQRYDLIISNPPYVNDESMQHLPKEYTYEPKMALAGGEDGMTLVKKIIHQARPWLTEQGTLILEIGYERAHLEAALGGLNFKWLPVSAGSDSVCLIHASDLPLPHTNI